MRGIATALLWLLFSSSALAVNNLPDPTPQSMKAVIEDERASRDLSAQETMAQWAINTGMLGIASTALSVLAVIFAALSWHASKKALRETVDSDIRQSQAYVHAAEATWGLRDDVIVECMNSGQTPATYFSIGAEAFRVKKGETRGKVVLAPKYKMKRWTALGAGLKLGATLELTRGKEALQAYHAGQLANDENVLVLGRIVYGDVFDKHYETGFAFFIDNSRHKRFLRPPAELRAYHRIDKPADLALVDEAVASEPAV